MNDKVESFLQNLIKKDTTYVNHIVDQSGILLVNADVLGLSNEDYETHRVYIYPYLDEELIL